MLEVVRLRARVVAGQLYGAAYNFGGALLRRFVQQGSALDALKRRVAGWLRPPPRRKLDAMLEVFAKAYPQARFVQVGSNDGMMEDPLRRHILRHRWRGVLVEPMPDLFERLKRNYAGREGLRFENVAVGPTPGTLPFYHLVPAPGRAPLPVWAAGLGSFSKEVLLSHAARIPQIADYVAERQVPVIRFDALCARNGIEALDLIHVDAEGHDHAILQTIDLERLRPRVVIYERHHLTPQQQSACVARLESLGYTCLHEGLDTYCVRTEEAGERDAALVAMVRALGSISEEAWPWYGR